MFTYSKTQKYLYRNVVAYTYTVYLFIFMYVHVFYHPRSEFVFMCYINFFGCGLTIWNKVFDCVGIGSRAVMHPKSWADFGAI